MLPYFPFLEAAYMAKMTGGGTAVEKYDRIAGLPTVFSFDMADGWRCELCADSNPTDIGKSLTARVDDWSEEFQSTVVYSKATTVYYLRILNNSGLKLITDLVQYPFATYAEWYASNGNVIGELMKTIKSSTENFRVSSVGVYNPNMFLLPAVNLEFTMTRITADSSGTNTETINSTYAFISSNTKFISKGDPDVNVYADFVKAVRKFSDEFNSSSSTT